jgi:diphosphomevalonate decarboxylase
MQTSTSEKTVLKTIWRCPSNIAIVKYWGKYGNQLPCNSSLSLTLSESFTEVELKILPKSLKNEIELNYFFEGKENPKFAARVAKYLQDNETFFPFLSKYAIEINSANSFPHSAGIASSASAFGAIALSLYAANFQLDQKSFAANFHETSSNLARLGSGSASRSMFANYALWGKNSLVAQSSNEFACPIENVHSDFLDMQDAILIVEDEPKKVSSSVGHALMNNHPYAQNRFQQANDRTAQLVEILAKGDWDEFIQLTESEALTLHAMMMTSKDYYLLMKAGTMQIIEKLFAFRANTQLPVCFTLDAGPNVHLLYPASIKNQIEKFIEIELKPHYKKVIFDKIGEGPVCISQE